MKMYMAYSAVAGQEVGAVLVFANTAKEAKKLAFKHSFISDLCNDEFTDVKAKLIRDRDYLWEEKRKDVPHVVDSPKSCESCLTWGHHEPIGEDGLCDGCREDLEEMK